MTVDEFCVMVDGYPLSGDMKIQDWFMEIKPVIFVCFPRRYIQLSLRFGNYLLSGTFPSCITVETVTKGFNNVCIWELDNL